MADDTGARLTANDRERLAIHTPVWDHNDLGFCLECGCGEFTHGGIDRAAAERRWVEHIGPTVERIIAARAEDAARLAEVERLLADFDTWTPYDSRDTGSTYLAESVTDLVRDVRAALGVTAPTASEAGA